MENLAPASTATICNIEQLSSHNFKKMKPGPLYGIYMFQGKGKIVVDDTSYAFNGFTILFTTPYQFVNMTTTNHSPIEVQALRFHGDYYCIEYHKREVACNGLLFNNIYNVPHITLNEAAYVEIQYLFSKLKQELRFNDPYARAIAQSYLQLMLAMGSKAKMQAQQESNNILTPTTNGRVATQFKQLLESNYYKERTPGFYAHQIGIAVNTLSKQCKTQFHKSPTFLIQQRVVLEAKRLIHLTQKSIKEIAEALHFEDQHYFSRYFKKYTGVSPALYRKQVGISQVAYLST